MNRMTNRTEYWLVCAVNKVWTPGNTSIRCKPSRLSSLCAMVSSSFRWDDIRENRLVEEVVRTILNDTKADARLICSTAAADLDQRRKRFDGPMLDLILIFGIRHPAMPSGVSVFCLCKRHSIQRPCRLQKISPTLSFCPYPFKQSSIHLSERSLPPKSK